MGTTGPNPICSEQSTTIQHTADRMDTAPSGRDMISSICNNQINNNSRASTNEDHSRGRKRDYNGELCGPRKNTGPTAPSDRDDPQETRNSKKRPYEQASGSDSNNNANPSPTGRKRQRPPRRKRRLRQPILDFGPGQLNIPADAIRPDNVYGDGVEPKLDGRFRLAYGNIDGFSTVA